MINYNLHDKTIRNKPIPKSDVYNQNNFLNKDKKILTTDVNKILYSNLIDPDTTGINIYESEDIKINLINIFRVNLNNDNNINKIAKILFTISLEPILIEFWLHDKVCFAVANIRINKKNDEKNIIDQIYITKFLDSDDKWINNLDFNKFNWTNSNLFILHQYIISIIATKHFNDEDIFIFESIDNGLEKLNELRELKRKIKAINNKIKLEKQFNKKSDLVSNKRDLNNQLEILLQK